MNNESSSTSTVNPQLQIKKQHLFVDYFVRPKLILAMVAIVTVLQLYSIWNAFLLERKNISLDEREMKLSKLVESKAELIREVSGLENQLKEKVIAINGLQKDSEDLSFKVNENESKKKLLMGEIEGLQLDNQTQQQSLNRAKVELTQIENEIQSATKDKKTLLDEQSKIKSSNAEARASSEMLTRRVEELKAQSASATTEASLVQDSLNKIKSELATLQLQRDGLKDEIKTNDGLLKEIKSKTDNILTSYESDMRTKSKIFSDDFDITTKKLVKSNLEEISGELRSIDGLLKDMKSSAESLVGSFESDIGNKNKQFTEFYDTATKNFSKSNQDAIESLQTLTDKIKVQLSNANETIELFRKEVAAAKLNVAKAETSSSVKPELYNPATTPVSQIAVTPNIEKAN